MNEHPVQLLFTTVRAMLKYYYRVLDIEYKVICKDKVTITFEGAHTQASHKGKYVQLIE